MSWSTVFKYFGLAMEAVQEAVEAGAAVSAAQSSDSPGGKEITDAERMVLIEQLDDNFSRVITRICQEFDLPVKSINVEIELE